MRQVGVFGLAYSAVLLGEPLSWHTGAGTVLVIVALWLGQRAVRLSES